MPELTIIFPEEFRRFVRPRKRDLNIRYVVDRKTSVKDIIEALGVPHTEVGRITAGGESVGFDWIPTDSNRIHIRPITPPFDVTKPSFLRPIPFSGLRFIVDVNVGKLALLLRILGLDTEYTNTLGDREIAERAESEQRIVLSKDTGLLKRNQVVFGRHIQSVRPDDQLVEVVRFFGIQGPFQPFSRCLRCNQVLEPVEKADILHRLQPKTKKYFNRFKTCPDCDRIYWNGSHLDLMKERLAKAGIYLTNCPVHTGSNEPS